MRKSHKLSKTLAWHWPDNFYTHKHSNTSIRTHAHLEIVYTNMTKPRGNRENKREAHIQTYKSLIVNENLQTIENLQFAFRKLRMENDFRTYSLNF